MLTVRKQVEGFASENQRLAGRIDDLRNDLADTWDRVRYFRWAAVVGLGVAGISWLVLILVLILR